MSTWSFISKIYHIRQKWFMGWILEKEKRNLRELLSGTDPSCILDIGTGTGSTLDLFPKAAGIAGLDLSLTMLCKTESRGNLFKVNGDALALPFKTKKFDLVSVIGVSEYLEDLAHFIEEITRVTRDNGQLLITLSPPGLWTWLRKWLGNRIYIHHSDHLMDFAANTGFKLQNRTKSFMQEQLLFIKDMS